LLVYLRTVGWLNERDLRKPEAIASYQAAWTALMQALEFERRGRLPPARTVGVFARALRALFARCNVAAPPATAEDETRFALKPEQPPAIDLFFSGAVHHYLAEAVPLAPARLVLLASLGSDLDLIDSGQAAEDQLREAIRLDPSQYWHHFVLGRVLLGRRKFAQAEDVFSACIALRPDYPVSHQFRALAICHQAQELPAGAAARRQTLVARAGRDADNALELARRTRNPAVHWARGDMFVVLADDARALEAYAEGLEADPELGQRVSRSKVLGRVERYAARLAASSKTPAAVIADAEAVLALVHLARGDASKAQEAAARALQAAPEHRRAQAIVERLRRQNAGPRAPWSTPHASACYQPFFHIS
jgi:tetratricopeptide (TPR) repeat protein